MKRFVVWSIAAFAAAPALAQSSVTLFGVAESQFGAYRNLIAAPVSAANPFGAAIAARSTVGSIPYGPNASRFGLRGAEALGSSLKATFVLESQFNMATGMGPARLFHRQANFGLSGGLGQLRIGRMYSAWNDIASNAAPGYGDAYDPFVRIWRIGGPVPLGSPVPNARGQVTGLAGTLGVNNDVGDPNNWSHVRMDNSIRYDTPSIHGVTLSAQIGLDDPSRTPTAKTFAALYQQGKIRAGIGYYTQSAMSQYNTATQKFDPNLQRRGSIETITAALNYDFGPLILMTMGGQSRYDVFSLNRRITSTEWSAGAQIPLNPLWMIKPSVAGSNSAELPGSDIGAAVEVQYSLSKRTSLYAAYSYSRYGELLYGQPDKTSYIGATGIRHFF
jgi:predicted porin